MLPTFISSAIAGKQSAPKAPPRRRPAAGAGAGVQAAKPTTAALPPQVATSSTASTVVGPSGSSTSADGEQFGPTPSLPSSAESATVDTRAQSATRTVTFAEPTGIPPSPPTTQVHAARTVQISPSSPAPEVSGAQQEVGREPARQLSPPQTQVSETRGSSSSQPTASFTSVDDHRQEAVQPGALDITENASNETAPRTSRSVGKKRAHDALDASSPQPSKVAKRTSTRSTKATQDGPTGAEGPKQRINARAISARDRVLAEMRKRGLRSADSMIEAQKAHDLSSSQQNAEPSNTQAPHVLSSAIEPIYPGRRKRNQKKQKDRATNADEDSDSDEVHTDDAPSEDGMKQSKKSRSHVRKRRRKGACSGHDGEEVENPEAYQIDATKVTMFDLSVDRRLGKTSEREKQMAQIDWEEVAKKRREEADRIAEGVQEDSDDVGPSIEDADGQASHAADDEIRGDGGAREQTPDKQGNADGTSRPQPSRPRPRAGDGLTFRIVNGEIVEEESSLRINRQEKIDIDNEAVEEENDLTARINRSTWVNERRRNPTDRVPAWRSKSDPWSDAETDKFYDMLRLHSTNFQFIAYEFPGKTRKQIKTKFNREERLDPDRVTAALIGVGPAKSFSLEDFAARTGFTMEQLNKYDDLKHAQDSIKADLAGKERLLMEEIEREKENQRQRDIQAQSLEKLKEAKEKKKAEKQAQNAMRTARGGQKLTRTRT